MSNICKTLMILFTLFITTNLWANTTSKAGDVYTLCKTYLMVEDKGSPTSTLEQRAHDQCKLYVSGLVHGYLYSVFHHDITASIFTPDGVTISQIISVVVDYLEKHKDHHHLLAAAQVMLALQEAYPAKVDTTKSYDECVLNNLKGANLGGRAGRDYIAAVKESCSNLHRQKKFPYPQQSEFMKLLNAKDKKDCTLTDHLDGVCK